MLTDTLRLLFSRDLLRVQQELSLYTQEPKIWQVEGRMANSAGNLCLHLVGNLRTYIGAELGGVAYARNRELEFTAAYVPRPELLRQLAATATLVDNTLARLPAEALATEYPLVVFEAPMSTEYFLVHLATHLAYHLGQITYHRRAVEA